MPIARHAICDAPETLMGRAFARHSICVERARGRKFRPPSPIPPYAAARVIRYGLQTVHLAKKLARTTAWRPVQDVRRNCPSYKGFRRTRSCRSAHVAQTPVL